MATEFEAMQAVLNQYDDNLTPAKLVAEDTNNSFTLFHFAQQSVRKEADIRRIAEVYQRNKSNGAAKSELDKELFLRGELKKLIAEAVRLYQRDG